MYTRTPRLQSAPPDLPALRRISAVSFHCDPQCLAELLGFLDDHGFQAIAARSPHELTRLRTPRGQLIVAYRTGTLLVQGGHVPETLALLEQLAVAS